MKTSTLNPSKKDKSTPADEIPVDWDRCLVESLAERGSGHTPNREMPEYWNGGIKWVSLTDSNKLDRRFIRATTSEISAAGIRHSSAVLHPKNTVILSRDAGVGKSAILGEPMAVSQHFIAWRCGPYLDPLYFYYWLQHKKPYFERMAVGSTIKTIGLSVFRKLDGAFPPIKEQRRIADMLCAWDEALDKIESLIERKEQQRNASATKLLSGRHRLRGFTNHWSKVRLDELLRFEDRYVEFDDRHQYDLVSVRRRSGGVFFRQTLRGDEIMTKVMKVVHFGDFLISRMQAVHGAIGMVREGCDGMFASDSYEVLVARNPELLYMPFLDWISRMKWFWQIILRCSHGVHIEKMTFSLPDFMRHEIEIPSDVSEQRAIAGILDMRDSEIRLLRQLHGALNLQKCGLIQRLLSGKLRVPNYATVG